MKLEHQVCSLEHAKRLEELGVKQESLYFWWWNRFGGESNNLIEDHEPNNPQEGWGSCSAFTVAELGEILPKRLYTTAQGVPRKLPFVLDIYWFEDGKHRIAYVNKRENVCVELMFADTEADARAKMLIYLIENSLISV